jgi:hypothetical protein
MLVNALILGFEGSEWQSEQAMPVFVEIATLASTGLKDIISALIANATVVPTAVTASAV